MTTPATPATDTAATYHGTTHGFTVQQLDAALNELRQVDLAGHDLHAAALHRCKRAHGQAAALADVNDRIDGISTAREALAHNMREARAVIALVLMDPDSADHLLPALGVDAQDGARMAQAAEAMLYRWAFLAGVGERASRSVRAFLTATGPRVSVIHSAHSPELFGKFNITNVGLELPGVFVYWQDVERVELLGNTGELTGDVAQTVRATLHLRSGATVALY